LKTLLKVKRRDALLLAVFYAAVGVVQLAALGLLDVRMVWVGMLGLLSLIAAYGLFTVKKWSVWLVLGLFFPQFVFGASTLDASFSRYISYYETAFLLLNVALAVFLVLSFVSFVYVAAKRNSFQQA